MIRKLRKVCLLSYILSNVEMILLAEGEMIFEGHPAVGFFIYNDNYDLWIWQRTQVDEIRENTTTTVMTTATINFQICFLYTL